MRTSNSALTTADAHPRLLTLLTLQAIAVAVGLEILFHVRWPPDVARKLPPRAAPLLPSFVPAYAVAFVVTLCENCVRSHGSCVRSVRS